MSQLPYTNIRIIELSNTVTGRLTGLLFADQCAEVYIERDQGIIPNEHSEYLLNALVGFFADLRTSSRFFERLVIYT